MRYSLVSFNTQPPEGGWEKQSKRPCKRLLFQHTAARRRLELNKTVGTMRSMGFNTQPPEGGWFRLSQYTKNERTVSTHSRPKAAGNGGKNKTAETKVSTHSRPKAAGNPPCSASILLTFQHTAARRRLESFNLCFINFCLVSTHSRPKAAGIRPYR